MKRRKFSLLLIIILGSFMPVILQGQVDTAWVRRYNGMGNTQDRAKAIVTDNVGNIYVTGTSGSLENIDFVTIKYNSNGVQQWIARYNGPANLQDEATALVIDGTR